MPLDHPVKQLLVDLDGTLLGNRNIALSYDFLKQTLSSVRMYGGFRQASSALLAVAGEMRKASKDLTNDRRTIEIFSKRMNVSIEEGARILRETVSTVFPTLERHFYPIAGAKDFLAWAQEKYPLTLATNPVWPPEIIELRVRWAGIDPSIFGQVTHARRMHAYKPSREYYLEILEQIGAKAEDCLLIGDNVKMDLPATRVGIPVFIVGKYKKTERLKYPGAKAQSFRGSYLALRKLLE
jgi:FMN phosphatase YigB (HAD superfamily)